jgi:hypothetical protein
MTNAAANIVAAIFLNMAIPPRDDGTENLAYEVTKVAYVSAITLVGALLATAVLEPNRRLTIVSAMSRRGRGSSPA